MKRNIILGIAMLAGTLALAQHKQRDPQQMAAHQTEKMKTALSLDDQQYAAVKKINDAYAVKFMSFRNTEKTGSSDDKHEEVKRLREEKQKEINAVLTPDQQAKWKTLREEKKAHRKTEGDRGHGKGKHKEHRTNLKTELSLTDDQASRLEEEQKRFREKKQAIKNESLTEDQREEKFKSIKTEHEVELKKILTAEQYEKLKTFRSEMKDKKHGRK